VRKSMAALAAAACLGHAAAVAQTAAGYPSKPVRFIVGLVPGGAPDIYARLMASELSQRFGHQFIVENRPSSGSIVAADHVAKSAADGHTVFVGATNVFTINPHIYPGMPFDPFRDLSPVSMGIATTMWLMVHASVNATNVKELVALAKAQPNPMPYASSGHGSIHHLTMEAFKEQAGVDFLHIPFKGATQTLPAFMSGQVQVAFVGYPPMLPAIKAGKVRVLGFAMDRRSSLTPDVPTVAEQGFPGFNMSGSTGQFVPAGTPREIIARLSNAFLEALRSAPVAEKIKAMGLEAIGLNTEQYEKLLRTEHDRMRGLIRRIGLKAE
jgi:tripartite-type tricarboxylate transporter receptor subunit TctC